MTGNGNSGAGSCTVEVVVDGAAEVQVRGGNATVRDLSGQQPQLRRFECTSAMPANPPNLRFSALEGRGQQQLVRNPANGGSAVVRIEDQESGAATYAFQLSWNSGGGYNAQQYPNNGYPNANGQYPSRGDRQYTGNQYPDNRNGYPDSRDMNRRDYGADQGSRDARNGYGYGDRDRNGDDNRYDSRDRYNDRNSYGDRDRYNEADRAMNPGFSADQAVGACQDAVRHEAYRRFGGRDLAFGRADLSDSGDAVIGTLEVQQGQRYRYSCSMELDTGRVRSVQMRPLRER